MGIGLREILWLAQIPEVVKVHSEGTLATCAKQRHRALVLLPQHSKVHMRARPCQPELCLVRFAPKNITICLMLRVVTHGSK